MLTARWGLPGGPARPPCQNKYHVRPDGGEIELMAPGFVTRGAELEYGPVPSLGQHDADIRAEFGLDTS